MLELPVDALCATAPGEGARPTVPLHRATSARDLLSDIDRAGVARFDCTVDPVGTELEPVLAIIDLIESRLPVPWDFHARPAVLTLREKVEMTARLTTLMGKIEVMKMGIYTHAAWIEAQYPRYDIDDGETYTMGGQAYEMVLTLQMLICRSGSEKVHEKPITKWGLDVKPVSIPSPVEVDDDLPF